MESKAKEELKTSEKKAHKPFIKEVTKFAVDKLTKTGGVKRKSTYIHDDVKSTLHGFLQNIVKNTIFHTKPARKPISTMSWIHVYDSFSRLPPPQELVAREAFALVNEFRRKNDKSELVWDRSLYNIALAHSEDMAYGKVPFSHEGFEARAAAMPFEHSLVAENLYMNEDCHDPAKSAVDGWINSPDHHDNMLLDANVSIIAIARSVGEKGKWYFTQLFVKKPSRSSIPSRFWS